MTPYIVISIVALGMLAAIPVVMYWDRQQRIRERERTRRSH